MGTLKLKLNSDPEKKQKTVLNNLITQSSQVSTSEEDGKKKVKPIPPLTSERISEYLNLLVTKYPKAFNIKNPKLLKLKVHSDIITDARASEDKRYKKLGYYKIVTQVLDDYCTRAEYLNLYLVDGHHRIDLEGNPIEEPIKDHHKEYARKKLAGQGKANAKSS